MSNSSNVKKAIWTPALHKIFVDLCLEQTFEGNKPGTHFTKLGWRNIVESFYEKTGLSYGKTQMKNHWDVTKTQWKTWVKLICDSNMKWDPITNKFGACEEDWAKYIQANPEAAHFQFKELPFTDKLEILFNETVGTEVLEPNASGKEQNNSSATSPSHLEEQMLELTDDETEHAFYATPLRSISGFQHGCRRGREISSKESLSGSSARKRKAIWTLAIHKVFLDLCVEETLKGNKPGTHFTKEGWRNIVESFDEKAGLRYDRVQLKNHWTNTKEQWRVWSKLIGTSSMKWDPYTNSFGATEEDWANYLQENPDATQFRFKQLQFADKLETMFEGTSVIEEIEPPIRRRRHNGNFTASMIQTEVTEHEPPMWKPDGMNEGLSHPVESRSTIIFQKSSAKVPSTQGKVNYSIGDCIECLDEMEEIEQGSDLYMFALDVFLRKEYREIFLQLKKPSVRISWLQRLRSVGSMMPQQ